MKFIAGPCVIESAELLDTVAERLVAINKALGTDIIFKASFDKANRTSISSFRGPGLEQGLRMLADVRAKWGLRLLTDIHEAWQAAPVGEVVDVIQIPAFLCRQTDLLTAAARTGKTVNIKKAQFLSGLDMQYPYEKARDAGASEIWLTERGNIYGYNNLVVDFRNIPDMLRIAQTVVMDCTHSVQRPGAAGGKTGQAVDARIVVAVFEAFVGGDWNAEQLCDLLLRIAKSFAFVAEAFSDFLTLFCGGRGHDSVVVELLGRRSV